MQAAIWNWKGWMRAWASTPLVRDEKPREKVIDGWMSDVIDVD
jgi:hypothetical protein